LFEIGGACALSILRPSTGKRRESGGEQAKLTSKRWPTGTDKAASAKKYALTITQGET
jgi:hypothetical protein